ncbi:hypothetical protein ANO11243_092230 [Dothideomycetidae sp. 11243]|nr:hypothetical protein ANO11243_092230 [fungal sp. No.11243]
MAPSLEAVTDEVDTLSINGDSLTPLCHIITPIGMLGYGFDEDLTIAELERLGGTNVPTALILDSGSTDSGPAKLALGSMTCPLSSYERDLKKLVDISTRFDVPVLISSAGGDGSAKHVDELVSVVEDIVNEAESGGKQTKVIAVYADMDKSLVHKRLEEGRITGYVQSSPVHFVITNTPASCGPAVPPLTPDDISSAPLIVAQMGPEPILDAMQSNPSFNILIAGRAYDPSPYIAFAAYARSQHKPLNSIPPSVVGGFAHMGKITECGALCALPKSKSARATVYTNGVFDITPLDAGAVCTPLSVAAHTLYEKLRPDLLAGPGGVLDLTRAHYTPLDDGKSVRVVGAEFRFSDPYTVKLEAARIRGFSSLFMGRMVDPILLSQLDDFLNGVRAYVKKQHRDVNKWWQLEFHTTGSADSQIFIVGEALAETQQLATSLVSCARIACTHGAYPGQKATSGNFAMGLGGLLEVETGARAEFCIYHVMQLDEGEHRFGPQGSSALFPWKSIDAGVTPREVRTHHNSYTNYAVPRIDYPAKRQPNGNGIKHPQAPETLGDLARVVRSKNAGPYEVTIDVIFDNPEIYRLVKDNNLLNSETVSAMYSLPVEDIVYCGYFDQAMAWKATIPRRVLGVHGPSGSAFDDDVHGSAQYLPVMTMPLPQEVKDQAKWVL